MARTVRVTITGTYTLPDDVALKDVYGVSDPEQAVLLDAAHFGENVEYALYAIEDSDIDVKVELES